MMSQLRKNNIYLIKKYFLLSTAYCLLITSLIGCATIPVGPPPPLKSMAGVYHRVKKDQTLWRISKVYRIDMEELARINRLENTSRIYVGELIFIPGAKEKTEDLTLETDFKDKAGDFIWPLRGEVNSFFGMKREEVRNKGVFIQVRENSSVLAARSGKVVFCSDALQGYGKTIIIDHLDGYCTVYAQNSKNLVKFNQLIKQGQVIAKAGSTGKSNTPELYFEIRKDRKPQNPFFYLP